MRRGYPHSAFRLPDASALDSRLPTPVPIYSRPVTHPPVQAPARAPWRRADVLILGGMLALAAVAAGIAWVASAPKVQSLVGLLVLLSIAFAWSSDRSAIDRKTVAWGLGLQIVIALIVLRTTPGREAFAAAGRGINWLLDFGSVGASFVFGPLGDKTVWPRIMTAALGEEGARYSVLFAFQVLPTIIFIASLFAILYYLGVMQLVVRVFAVGMRWVMKASGAETLNVAASIFMGQTEAPLTIRPVPGEDDAVGAHDRDDVGHGPHLRRHHGGLRALRHRGAAPADGRDHDRARAR